MAYLCLGIAAAAVLAAVYYMVRYRSLCRALKGTARELEEITEAIGENRIVKQEMSQPELEELLTAINHGLKSIRAERVRCDRREREFQRQIEDISHDLRTPLTSILGYLKLLDTRSMSREEQEDLEVIRRKAEALQRLIQQFYDLSRAGADDFAPKLQIVDAAKLLRETVLDGYPLLEGRGIACEITIPSQPVEVLGNREMLERIFGNLIQNAGRYGKTYCKVSMEQAGETVRILFENDGGDASEEELNRLFQRFYVKDEARSQEGTGLGLTIARGFAEKMSGTLTADCPAPGRLRFVVELHAGRAVRNVIQV